jgi:hypothetical protein
LHHKAHGLGLGLCMAYEVHPPAVASIVEGAMGASQSKSRLEINIDEAFEEKDRRARSIARWLLLAFVLTGALGLLGGGGLLARQRAEAGGELTVRYDRAVRAHAIALLSIETTGGSDTTIWISSSLRQGMALEEITPEPVAMVSERGRVVLHFAKQRPERIAIRYKRTRWGRLKGELGSGRERVQVSQFVLF